METSHVIHSAVNRLRDKFSNLNIFLDIENLRGIGYRFILPKEYSDESAK